MKLHRFIYQSHIWIGLVVSLSVLAWASSGLLYALPSVVEGGKIRPIQAANVKIAPADALQRANDFAGKALPITALTLLTRDGREVYQAVGGMGAESLLIDAETGNVIQTPPPNMATRYFRQAHFYYFAGSWQIPLLLLMTSLACLLALSGIYLNIRQWTRRRK